MTTYKFRGKRLDNGEWVYGSLIQEPHRCRIFTHISERASSLHEVDPATVGMWTGLTDLHNIEVYNGDVIRRYEKSYRTGKWYPSSTPNNIRLVEQYTFAPRGPLNAVKASKWVILGNIHDTPNLHLKKKDHE